jgi:16S rRNA (guanine527-N7)-methyltransferase
LTVAPPTFAQQARALGIELTPNQVGAFAVYRDLILDAAERFNLTAVRDPLQVERRHFLESLALGIELVRLGAMPRGGAVGAIDVGSGAGIPGIPLKIAWPALDLALLESNEKRCQFLRTVVQELDLEGVRVLEGRAETFGRARDEREHYDLALARAVAPLAVLLEYCLPFLRVGGWLAAPKGSAAPREIIEARRALAELGGEIVKAPPFEPPGGPAQTLVVVRKVRQTPDRYPRREGTPARRPLA